MRACVGTPVRVQLCGCARTHVCVRTHTHTHTRMHACGFAQVCKRVCTRVQVCIRAHVLACVGCAGVRVRTRVSACERVLGVRDIYKARCMSWVRAHMGVSVVCVRACAPICARAWAPRACAHLCACVWVGSCGCALVCRWAGGHTHVHAPMCVLSERYRELSRYITINMY